MNENEEVLEMEEGSPAFNELGNSNLGSRRNKSFKKEHFSIRLEMRRLGLRKGMRYEPKRLTE